VVVPRAVSFARGGGRRALGGGLSRGGLRGGGAQFREQLLQVLRVFAERFLAGGAILVLRSSWSTSAARSLARLFERGQLRALRAARAVQRGAALGDLLFERVEFVQVRGEWRMRAARSPARNGGRPACAARRRCESCASKRLERCVVADGVGGAHQAAQFGAARGKRGVEGVAALLQVGERGGFVRERAFGVLHGAAHAAHLFVGGRATGARRPPALAFELAAFGGHVLQLAAHLLQALLGVAAALRGRRPRGDHQQGSECERDGFQAGVSRLAPVISAGCGRPSRSRMVGATSRRAPPLRNCAARVPDVHRTARGRRCARCAVVR
jgi:hypothetical protein